MCPVPAGISASRPAYEHLNIHTNVSINRVCVSCASFILMMYTDMWGCSFPQFAFNQCRFMMIHGFCCWSQFNPSSGPWGFTADMVVNYPLPRRRIWIDQRSQNSSALRFKGQLWASRSSRKWNSLNLLVRKSLTSQLFVSKSVDIWSFTTL